LYSDVAFFKPEFYGQWNLNRQQGLHVLTLLNKADTESAVKLCNSLRQVCEPMQTAVEEVYYDDLGLDSENDEKPAMSL
ncbi:MAG: hypothetical protein ACHP9Y_06020, partial [Gammaproteobacteria bacterium]